MNIFLWSEYNTLNGSRRSSLDPRNEGGEKLRFTLQRIEKFIKCFLIDHIHSLNSSLAVLFIVRCHLTCINIFQLYTMCVRLKVVHIAIFTVRKQRQQQSPKIDPNIGSYMRICVRINIRMYVCAYVRVYLFVCSETVHTLRIYQSKEHKICKPTAYSLSPRLSWPSLDLFALLSPVRRKVCPFACPPGTPAQLAAFRNFTT